MKKILSFYALVGLVILGCGTRPGQDYLARVNQDFISVAEFSSRLSYFMRLTGIRDNLQTRETLLDNMINERLLIQDFSKRGLDRLPEFQRKLESIRTQFYLNAFRKRAFYDTIAVSDREIRQKFAYYNQKVSARHLYARTEPEANELYRQLQQGANFEELARISFRDPTLASNGGYLGYFGKDEMDPEFERVAFSLKIGEISQPVKTRYGFSIIKVEDRIVKPLVSESEFLAARPKIEKLVRKEKSMAKAQDYGNQLAAGLDLKFNDQLVQFIFLQLQEGADRPEIQFRPENLLAPDLLAQLKNKTIVSFKKGKWTVADFLDRALLTSKRQQARIRDAADLKQFITGLVVREQLVKQALELGVDRDPEVRRQLDHAIEGYVVGQMRKMIIDTATVPLAAAKEEFQRDSTAYVFPAEANVREILIADKKLADQIMERLHRGESFDQLARQYSERQWARARGGELGFAPRTRYGALADTIFSLQAGEILGPIEIEGYYSIVQMIAKKPARQKSFEQARSRIELEQLWKWRKIRLHNYISQLRDQAQIEVNTKKLRWTVFKTDRTKR